jgi:large subunit ribosomal protein L15
MLQLNNLTPLVKKRKRIGRGGSRGGTSTKGHKGQIARSGGYVRPGFEGGQMPLFRRLPKRGFNNAEFQKVIDIVNVGQLNDAFQENDHVDLAALIKKGLVKSRSSVVQQARVLKVLGQGELTKRMTVIADAFSASALATIEKAGGKAQIDKER